MKNKNNISYTSPQNLASLSKSTPVLVAYSGGADSSALLHLLNEDAKNKGYKIHAAHFNHKIRGDEAERDAEFCKSTCNSLDIPFHIESADIPALAKESGNSVETEARERRYAFFERIMLEHDIPILVTAHHAEDQIESIMLHILRGSGIQGLCGMSDCRALSNGLFLVRPLLHTEKDDILSYCAQNNIEFVTDSTNSDTNYARNFIRSELTPRMKSLQPNLACVFSRLSESATETNDLVNDLAESFLVTQENQGISLSEFSKLHSALQSRVLSIAFNKYSNGASLENTHIKSIIELCKKAEAHSSISLPYKTAAKIENGFLIFESDKIPCNDDEFILPFAEGKFKLPNGILINIERNSQNNPSKSDVFLDFKCDIIKDNLHFRSRKDGDTIVSGKMNKKVKKLLNEKKIPLDMRKKLPILVCENEILWIPTIAVCDRIKNDIIIDESDFYRITIKFEN